MDFLSRGLSVNVDRQLKVLLWNNFSYTDLDFILEWKMHDSTGFNKDTFLSVLIYYFRNMASNL